VRNKLLHESNAESELKEQLHPTHNDTQTNTCNKHHNNSMHVVMLMHAIQVLQSTGVLQSVSTLHVRVHTCCVRTHGTAAHMHAHRWTCTAPHRWWRPRSSAAAACAVLLAAAAKKDIKTSVLPPKWTQLSFFSSNTHCPVMPPCDCNTVTLVSVFGTTATHPTCPYLCQQDSMLSEVSA
jgi:hypothetical protein